MDCLHIIFFYLFFELMRFRKRASAFTFFFFLFAWFVYGSQKGKAERLFVCSFVCSVVSDWIISFGVSFVS